MIILSDAMAAMMAGDTGLRLAASNFFLDFFVGSSQPASANDAESGQKIISFRKSAAGVNVFVADTQAQWKLTLNGTASGSLDTVMIGGIDILGGSVPYATSFTAMAAAAALQINNFVGNTNFTATSSGADLYIIAPRGCGIMFNAIALTTTVTTMTATPASSGYPATSGGTAGVAAAYACNFLPPVSGAGLTPPVNAWQLQQEAATWSGKAGYDATNSAISGYTSGILTAGWARLKTSLSDTGGATSGANGFARIDFSVGTSNSYDCVMSPSAQFSFGTINYLNGMVLNIPKSA